MDPGRIPTNRHNMTLRKSLLGATLVLLACAGTSAMAQDHDRDRGRPGRPGTGAHFDGRFGHNHYYPSRGFVYGTLPIGAVSIGFGGGNYFFHGGVWYRPYSGRYIVVQPPLGIFINTLPPDYATIWVGGVPYYYADDVYYNVAPGRGYVVVAPPPGIDTNMTRSE